MILNDAFDINKANRAESLSFCCIFGFGWIYLSIYLFILLFLIKKVNKIIRDIEKTD